MSTDFASRLCWYVGEKYLRDLKGKEEFSPRVLASVEALADFLVSEVRNMERGSDAAKKEAKEAVPNDRVKDAASLARELRWRVRLAGDLNSDDEHSRRKLRHELPNGNKRKRDDGDDARPLFKNFQPKAWQLVSEQETDIETQTLKMSKPADGEQLGAEWLAWGEEVQGTDGEDVDVERRKDVSIKVRRTAGGIERQRIERVWETWSWKEGTDEGPPPAPGPMEVDMNGKEEES